MYLQTSNSVKAHRPASELQLPCWCGHAPWRTVFRSTRFGLLHCSACGSCRIDPPPLANERRSTEFYTEYYAQTPLSGQRTPARNGRHSKFWDVCRRFPALLKPRTTALDVGCGDGHFCAELKDSGWPRVIGVDASLTRIALARRAYPGIDFVAGTLAESCIPKASIDLAVMDSVIEHLPNPVDVLQQARSYLSPGGHIVLLTPNMDSGHFRVLGRRWTGMLAPHVHIFLFNARSLSRLLRRAGFDVLASGSLHFAPYHPADWVRWIAKRQFKDVIWRMGHEIAGLYGRLIRSGPLLYVVARRPA